jgi:hypothetical protein
VSIDFQLAAPPDDEFPTDSVPDLSDVEYPCQVCGKESGPYGGRGRKPKFCSEHKKTSKATTGNRKVTGAPATLAAQATAVLVQVNGMIALGCMGMSMFKTSHAIAEANPTFEEQAYQALLTDTELCRMILKSGAMSAKMSLGLAYVGMGMAVAPAAIMEIQEKRETRRVKMEQAQDDESRS